MTFKTKGGEVFINWINQYGQFWEKCNWYTFALIEIDKDVCIGETWCLDFVILGLGFSLRYNTNDFLEKCDSLVSMINNKPENDV